MITAIDYNLKEHKTQVRTTQRAWQRIVLLSVIGYEAIGCLAGGAMLIAAPNGRYMEMPVEIMHGAFRDFLIPGIILFGLGILNSFAFVSLLRKSTWDWFMAGLAMGGLAIWFIVEIAILQELHWLHFMWGFPVFVGCVLTIPLIAARHDEATVRQVLLVCGMLSSLWYAGINIYVPLQYDGYSIASLTVSELSAIGAPTRILWVLVALPYPLLFAAFGWGVLQSSDGNRRLRVVAVLILVYSVVNFFWPPMHQREVIAAGGGTLTDTLHIAWAMMTLCFMMLLMGFGAAALNGKFRIYTIATWVVFLVFGVLTGMESPGIELNGATPYIGIWERINIAAFMLWVIVLATRLLRSQNLQRY